MKPRNNEIDRERDQLDEQDDAGELVKKQSPQRPSQQQQGDGTRKNPQGGDAGGSDREDEDIEGRGGKSNVHPDDDGADETDEETAGNKRK